MRRNGEELRLHPVELLELLVPLLELRGRFVDPLLQRSVEFGELGHSEPQLLPEPASLESPRDGGAQLFDLAGLDEVVVRPRPQRLDRRLERRVAGEHDRDGLGIALADGLENIEAVAVLETEVGQNEVVLDLAHHLSRQHSTRRRDDVIAVELEDSLDRDDDALFVVDDEDLRLLAHRSAVLGLAT